MKISGEWTKEGHGLQLGIVSAFQNLFSDPGSGSLSWRTYISPSYLELTLSFGTFLLKRKKFGAL